jgi:secreted PhoX family phosphatase
VPPVGSEVCSPAFTPDGKTMFLSIQHPGELRLDDGEDSTSIADAGTNWPDFIEGQGPRPSLVVITKDDDAVIGS